MQFGHCYHSSVNLNFSGRLPDSYFCAVLCCADLFLPFPWSHIRTKFPQLPKHGIYLLPCNATHHISSHCDICMLCWPSLITIFTVLIMLWLLHFFSLLHSIYTPFLLLCQCMGVFCFADDRSFVQAITYPQKKRGSFVQARVLLILRKCQQWGSGDLQG